jgi:hypothetical protein
MYTCYKVKNNANKILTVLSQKVGVANDNLMTLVGQQE